MSKSTDITPEEMKAWRKAEGITQAEFGDMIGWEKAMVAKIETGRRGISESEQRLLKLLIRGEMPFASSPDEWSPRVAFTDSEWALMTRIAHREGYHSARLWIIAKIRGYLAMCEKDQENPKKSAPQPPEEDKPA